MKFLIECLDKPDSSALRAEHRPAHRAYLEAIQPKLFLAGGLVDEAGATRGSLFIAEVADWAEAKDLIEQEPNVKAGVFASVAILEFRHLISDGVRVV
jgi:uncharacterized protein YciI